MKANYHTHTHFCGHAAGSASDYAEEAIKCGLKILGISDHAPNPLVNDHNVRMNMNRFGDYIKDIEVAQQKYSDSITIYKGIEVEYFDNHEEYYVFLRNKLDYMIHGQHYISKTREMNNLLSSFALSTPEEIEIYANYLCDAMDSGLFDCFAHPDLYLCGYKTFDQYAKKVAIRLCEKAKETDSVFEYNANGYRRGSVNTERGVQPLYPRSEFWDIVKEYEIKTIIGSDCHHPKLLLDNTFKKAEEEYHKFSLVEIEYLDIK